MISTESGPGVEPIGLIGFRYDTSSSFKRGAAGAPPLIREAFHSSSSNRWTEDGLDLGRPGLIFDAGDVTPPDGPGLLPTIEDAVLALLDAGRRPLALGGDHFITYPILRAMARRHPDLTVIQVDAHPDLYDELDGNRFSHACPFARIMEEKLVRRLVQVGIRTLNGHQREQAGRFGVEIVEMKDWPQTAALVLDGPVYLSVDLDGLDPACAPGVAHREPGGPTTRQVLAVIQALDRPLVGADLVEFNPRLDQGGVTATVCAKLMKEIAGRMLATAN